MSQSNILVALVVTAQLLMFSGYSQAQPSEPRMSKQDYIERFSQQAVREMHASGVPASITLAQGMLESDYGNSPLAKYANNHFGIKCHKGWEGPTFIQDDDEANECFRKYYSAYDSYRDHSEFLRTRDRYSSLFDLKTTDYKGWARGLKAAGYATNPKYADLLIKIIEENELHQFDEIITMPEEDLIAQVAKPLKEPDVPQVMSVRSVKVSGNNIKYILAKQGETPESIANRNNMGLWQILKYNDLEKGATLMAGDIVYLQPKRNHAKQEFHIVEPGESMRSISQKHGVKMKKILKYNNMSAGEVPQPGDKLRIKKVSKFNAFFTGR